MKRGRLSASIPTEGEPVINLTPLIDVVFVLLMAFMIIMPLITLDNISLCNSSKERSEEKPQHNVVIKVFANNRILVNDCEVSITQLTGLLQEAQKQTPEAIPLLLQDGESSFHTYQTIKEAAETAGFATLHVALSPT